MLNQLTGFLSNQFQVVKSLGTLVKLEAKLAHLSAKRLIFSICALGILILTTWINLLIIVGYVVDQVTHQFWLALLSVLFLNVTFLAILLKYAKKNIQNMQFEQTKNFLHQWKEHDPQTIEKPNNAHSMPVTNA